MRVVVALEYHFYRSANGSVWTPTTFAYPFWQRYLDVFDEVCVVARVQEALSIPPDWKTATGDRVSFTAIPNYVGPWEYLQRARQVKLLAQSAVNIGDAVILRVPSQIATCMMPKLHQFQIPYAVEVVADPYDVFSPKAVEHPLRPFFRWWIPKQLRQQSKGACASSYVTREALQRRYPPKLESFTTYYSDVELENGAFIGTAKSSFSSPITLITVAALDQLYKATDVLIDAVAHVTKMGIDLTLIIVGDGRHRSQLEQQAARLGISDRVLFKGKLTSGAAVRSQLKQADVFVLPSRQEGLPRAMVEAMAQGLPCIGSTVGGIPELLPPEDMVPPGDAIALAQKIREIVTCPERMVQQSARNLEKAHEYQEEHLVERRLAFYKSVRDQTEAWLKLKKS